MQIKIHHVLLVFTILISIITLLFIQLLPTSELDTGKMLQHIKSSEITYNVKFKLSDYFIERLKGYEGYESTPYRDGTGNLIIGYGRNISKHKNKPTRVDKNKAHEWLVEDILKHKNIISERTKWFDKLSSVRKEAIIDLTFNMGEGWLNKFPKVVSAIEKGNYKLASKHLLYKDSNFKIPSLYARQTGKRAKSVAHALANNAWL